MYIHDVNEQDALSRRSTIHQYHIVQSVTRVYAHVYNVLF